MMTPARQIIFDFDGTLADTLGLAIDSLNALSSSFGYARIDAADLPALRPLTMRQLLRKFRIRLYQIPLIDRQVRAVFARRQDEIILFDGIVPVLHALSEQGILLGIVTSNGEPLVRAVLRRYGLGSLFSFVYSSRSIFGKGAMLKKTLRTHHWNPSTTWYVGDEVRDIEAARSVRLPIVSVSWGFNAREILAAHHPDEVIDIPDQLLALIARLRVQRD